MGKNQAGQQKRIKAFVLLGVSVFFGWGWIALEKGIGAGEGNRTLIASLEGWSFTTKLHPPALGHIQ